VIGQRNSEGMTTAFVATELLLWIEVVAFKMMSLSWIGDGMMQCKEKIKRLQKNTLCCGNEIDVMGNTTQREEISQGTCLLRGFEKYLRPSFWNDHGNGQITLRPGLFRK
jgi:hypothetical protein